MIYYAYEMSIRCIYIKLMIFAIYILSKMRNRHLDAYDRKHCKYATYHRIKFVKNM